LKRRIAFIPEEIGGLKAWVLVDGATFKDVAPQSPSVGRENQPPDGEY